MGLLSIKIPTQDVMISDGVSIAVRGLTVGDVLSVYHRHRGQLSAFFDQLQEKDQLLNPTEVLNLLLAEIPLIAAELIVVAVGEGLSDAVVAHVAKFPIAVQIDALSKIGEMTFTAEMPMEKMFAAVAQLAQKTTAKIESA